MTTSIKELIEQAGFLNKDEESIEYFAELVIKDIIDMLESERTIRHIAYTTYDLSVVEGTVEKIANIIINRYNVKHKYNRRANERTMGGKISTK